MALKKKCSFPHKLKWYLSNTEYEGEKKHLIHFLLLLFLNIICILSGQGMCFSWNVLEVEGVCVTSSRFSFTAPSPSGRAEACQSFRWGYRQGWGTHWGRRGGLATFALLLPHSDSMPRCAVRRGRLRILLGHRSWGHLLLHTPGRWDAWPAPLCLPGKIHTFSSGLLDLLLLTIVRIILYLKSQRYICMFKEVPSSPLWLPPTV